MIAPFAQMADDSKAGFGEGAFSEAQPIKLPSAVFVPAGPQLFAVPDLTGFHELRIWAESFEDTQKARIACENRMLRGGVPPSVFVGQIEALKQSEHMMALAMRRTYRRIAPPGVVAWQKSTFGIGEHLLSRLLGALGHPRIATPFHWEGEGDKRTLIADAPFERTVRQLWSYCGHGDASRKRRKGMSVEEAFALGSPRCKMLVHLLAEASIKCRVEPITCPSAVCTAADPTSSPQEPTTGSSPNDDTALADPTPESPGTSAEAVQRAAAQDSSPEPSIPLADAISPSAVRGSSVETPSDCAVPKAHSASRRYRMTYDQARERYADRADWTLGHQHNAALRLVAKHILADLWEASI